MNELNFKKAVSIYEIEFCYYIRKKVFCDEQKISKDIEFDGLDNVCEHFLITKNKEAIATARVRKKENYIYKIERVSVLISHRRNNVGTLLIREIVNKYKKIEKKNSLILHSQVTSENFYKSINFIPYGKQFLEDGIFHIAMRYLA